MNGAGAAAATTADAAPLRGLAYNGCVMLIDGDLYLEGCVVEVLAFPAVVRLGPGVTCYAHRGVVLDLGSAGDSAVAYLAAGALVDEPPAVGVVERAEVSVVAWDPRLVPAPRGRRVVDVAAGPGTGG